MSDQIPIENQSLHVELAFPDYRQLLAQLDQLARGHQQSQEQSHDQSQEHNQPQNQPQEQPQDQNQIQQINHQFSQPNETSQDPGMVVDAEPQDTGAKTAVDARSVYVGNVDYGSTPLELQQHFSESGVVERVTIQTNKLTGQAKGFAYVEFALTDGARNAVANQDGSEFRGRELKVSIKRTNVPGLSARGRGFRGRGFMRGRGRGFRGRGRARFSPY